MQEQTSWSSTVVVVLLTTSKAQTPTYVEVFKRNLDASKPSEHPPQVEECLKV